MNGHHMARPGMGSAYPRGRVSKRWLSRKESDLARVTHELGPSKGGGTCQYTERMRQNEGHSPLETAEEEIRRRRPREGHPRAGARRQGKDVTEGKALTSGDCRGMIRRDKRRKRPCEGLGTAERGSCWD